MEIGDHPAGVSLNRDHERPDPVDQREYECDADEPIQQIAGRNPPCRRITAGRALKERIERGTEVSSDAPKPRRDVGPNRDHRR